MTRTPTVHHIADRAPQPALLAEPGSYALILHLPGPILLAIPRLGMLPLMAGDYIYAGSARGSGGLAGRVARHLRPPEQRRARWHIDYLTAVALPIAVIAIIHDPRERYECVWAATLARQPGVSRPMPRFGSSDCACPAHLFRWPNRLDPDGLLALLR